MFIFFFWPFFGKKWRIFTIFAPFFSKPDFKRKFYLLLGKWSQWPHICYKPSVGCPLQAYGSTFWILDNFFWDFGSFMSQKGHFWVKMAQNWKKLKLFWQNKPWYQQIRMQKYVQPNSSLRFILSIHAFLYKKIPAWEFLIFLRIWGSKVS